MFHLKYCEIFAFSLIHPLRRVEVSGGESPLIFARFTRGEVKICCLWCKLFVLSLLFVSWSVWGCVFLPNEVEEGLRLEL